MIRAVVFDVGGVLAHDVVEHLFLDQPHGIAALLDLDAAIVTPAMFELWDEFAYGSLPVGIPWKQLERQYWQGFIQRFGGAWSPQAFIDVTDTFIQPVCDMPAVVRDLAECDMQLLICSNNTEFFFARQMQKTGLNRYFADPQHVILSCRSGVPKADPSLKMFHDVLAVAACHPEECLFVDDRVENIERAIMCGLSPILFPREAAYGARYLRRILRHLAVLP